MADHSERLLTMSLVTSAIAPDMQRHLLSDICSVVKLNIIAGNTQPVLHGLR